MISTAVAARELAAPSGPRDLDCVGAAYAADPDALIAAVRRHRLEAPLADVLDRLDLPVPAVMADDVADDRVTRLRVAATLRRVAEVLDGDAIPWVTFKGPVLSALMTRPELRTYNDLDLLVGAADLERALDVLGGCGVQEINRNWAPYIRHRVGEVPLDAGDLSVDLHWHVVGLGRQRRAIRFDPVEMLGRRRSVRVGDENVPTFDAADQLLHLAVHAATAGATRLDQLRDIAVAVSADAPDWTEFERRARVAGVATLVAHALDRSARLLDAPVDEAVLRRMAGRSLDRRRRADGERVVDLKGRGVWWRRDRSLDSLRDGGAQVWETIRRGAGGWDFADERSHVFFEHDSGGPEGRRRYLDLVREHA